MSLTLGEKLRQAREERGFTLSEVAEQTRISPLYLESIENDDYRILPGGIFNKGFVKSYAKFVGINEQEALMDYSSILNSSQANQDDDLKVYRPEVLTDDRFGSSMAPTIIAAVVILGLMTAGILFLVNYLRRPAEPVAVANTNRPATNANAEAPVDASPAPPSGAPDMASVKIEFKATSQPVRLMATKDGERSDSVVPAGSSQMFEPKESLTLNYNRWNASVVQLAINGKSISLPAEPIDNPKGQRIEFTISKDNLSKIWTDGAISGSVPAAVVEANVNASAPVNPGTTPGPATPRPSPSAAPAKTPPGNTNPVPRPTADKKPAPASTPKPPPANDTN